MADTEPQRPQDDALAHEQRRARRPRSDRRLARARAAPLGGVAAGLAAFVGADPRHVRWAFAIGTLLSLGIGAVVYALLWILLPHEASAPKR